MIRESEIWHHVVTHLRWRRADALGTEEIDPSDTSISQQ